MKYENEDMLEYCSYCKEEILFHQGFVVKKGKYYHLECYHTIIDVPMEVEAEEINENTRE
jgi:hypothetical protein